MITSTLRRIMRAYRERRQRLSDLSRQHLDETRIQLVGVELRNPERPLIVLGCGLRWWPAARYFGASFRHGYRCRKSS